MFGFRKRAPKPAPEPEPPYVVVEWDHKDGGKSYSVETRGMIMPFGWEDAHLDREKAQRECDKKNAEHARIQHLNDNKKVVYP